MSSIMEQMEPECSELFVLEFRKIAEFDFIYTLALQILTNQHETYSKCM